VAHTVAHNWVGATTARWPKYGEAERGKPENPTPQPNGAISDLDGYSIVVAMSELDIVYELNVTTVSHDELKMFFFFFFFGSKSLDPRRGVTVPTFSTVILTFGILNVASHTPQHEGKPRSRTVLVPCPSSQRASHALVLTGYGLVSIARSRLIHARCKRDHPPQSTSRA